MSEKVRIAFNCPRQLLEEFDKAIEGKYGDRTAAILDGKKSLKVPEECPYIKTCSAKVFKEQAKYICLTSSWVFCDLIKKGNLKKYKLTPKEWKEIIEQ